MSPPGVVEEQWKEEELHNKVAIVVEEAFLLYPICLPTSAAVAAANGLEDGSNGKGIPGEAN